MTYPNNPYGQQPQQPGYGGYPQQPQQPPYGQPAPGYGAPQPGYPAPSQPGYPVQPGYAAPQPAYAAPQPAYGAPQPGYPAPQPGYGAPGGYSPYGAQNPYAHWGSRVGAYLIDGLIFGLPAMIFQVLAGSIGTESVECDVNSTTFATSCTGGGYNAVGLICLLLAIALGIGGIAFLAYQEGNTGQTPGKKMLGIRLISESTGQPIGFGSAFGRKLCHIADALPCYIGFLWPLWDDKKQTFADKIVGTVVVRA